MAAVLLRGHPFFQQILALDEQPEQLFLENLREKSKTDREGRFGNHLPIHQKLTARGVG